MTEAKKTRQRKSDAAPKRKKPARPAKANGSGDALRESPTMAKLLDALEAGTDVGHYGHFTFATVARHFLDADEVVALLAKQPDLDETKAKALVMQVQEKGYSPPKRERLLEFQAKQDFKFVDENDPDSGNLYRELRFPEGVYEHISEYYEEKAEA